MINIFIDTASLYFSGKKKYGNKLDYKRILEYCKDFGPLNSAIAYVSTQGESTQPFITFLNNMGYLVTARTPDCLEKSIYVPSYYGEMFEDVKASNADKTVLFTDSRTFHSIAYMAESLIVFSHYDLEIPATNIIIPPSLMWRKA
jgi:hypothetical protein